jgi:hypothetical protein
MQWHYLSPEARDVIIDWEETSDWCIGWLRMDAAQHPNDAARQAVLTSLMAIQDFRSRWDALVIPPDPNTGRWLIRDVENSCDVTLDMRVWLPAHPEDGILLMGAIIS